MAKSLRSAKKAAFRAKKRSTVTDYSRIDKERTERLAAKLQASTQKPKLPRSPSPAQEGDDGPGGEGEDLLLALLDPDSLRCDDRPYWFTFLRKAGLPRGPLADIPNMAGCSKPEQH
jgi:hypothetical protein